jgi:peptidyl-Lys metalloendopeptidase
MLRLFRPPLSAQRHIASILALAAIGMLPRVSSSAIAASPPCAGTELTTAKSAMVVAKEALTAAIAALDSSDNDSLDKAATWLGVRSSSDAQAAKGVLQRALTLASDPSYLCDNSTYRRLGDVYAHVAPTDPFVIKLGAFFWPAPDRGYDSKPGALVHEMTHFGLVGATRDLAGDLASSRALAQSNPAGARANANNYEYFVEAVVFGLR